MSGLKPRSYDDHVRLFTLAQLNGYSLLWEARENGRNHAPARAAGARPIRRLASWTAERASSRRRAAQPEPSAC